MTPRYLFGFLMAGALVMGGCAEPRPVPYPEQWGNACYAKRSSTFCRDECIRRFTGLEVNQCVDGVIY